MTIVELGDDLEARFEPERVGLYLVKRGPKREVVEARLLALMGPRAASVFKGELAEWLKKATP